MADKYSDILKSLKDCHLRPPQNLFKKIWSALMQQNNSQDLSSVPGELIDPAINSDEEYVAAEIDVFRSLQSYIITPPAFSTLKIGNGISPSPDTYPAKKTAGVFKLAYLIRIAAAVLVICCGIWIAYTFHAKKDNTSTALNTFQKNTLPVSVNIDSAQNTAATQKPASGSNNLIAGISKDNSINKYRPIENLKIKSTIAHEEPLHSKDSLVDNDMLLTLVSYKYPEDLTLLSEIKRNNNEIKLDQFSYVDISEKMDEILEKMYATNKNNKPTRKAKRIKAKIEKWEKVDEKHFDTNAKNNPVDIIDLSEFILK